jgi:hypothetical protein
VSLQDPVDTVTVQNGVLVVTLTDGQVLEEPTTLRTSTSSPAQLRAAGWDLVRRRRAWAGVPPKPPQNP